MRTLEWEPGSEDLGMGTWEWGPGNKATPETAVFILKLCISKRAGYSHCHIVSRDEAWLFSSLAWSHCCCLTTTTPLPQSNTVSSSLCVSICTCTFHLPLLPTLTPPPAEGPHRSMVAHFLYQLLSFLGVPDHRVRVTNHCTLFYNSLQIIVDY